MEKLAGYAIVIQTAYGGVSMLAHIQDIVKGVSNCFGDEYFTKITIALHKAITADYTFIARVNVLDSSCKTEVLVAKGVIAENFEYALKNTPCANVVNNAVCFIPKDVCIFYPEDQLLLDMKIQAYIGTPLVDSKQQVIGLIVALFETGQNNTDEASALFQIFAGRIAAELERLDYERTLEEKISKRTLELSNTVEQLQLTQKQLVESEKMSALGNLVAGVSHEVNTPLGIAITTHSLMSDEFDKLKGKLDTQKLSMKDMEQFRNTLDSALNMQGENLSRAKLLIENFKKTAADQHQLEIEVLDIAQYYQKIISTLRSILKPHNVNLVITCEEEIILATYPGIHAQILTNLINNSVKHGFSNHKILEGNLEAVPQENKISIELKQVKNTDGEVEVEVIYTDNGRGLSEKANTHIFEPFFTTAREHGGVGLGMSIVFNLISQKLNGSIKLEEINNGACFHYKFKESIFSLPS